MIVLDSNVISASMRQESAVVEWLDAQPQSSLWTTSVCVYEMLFGIECLPKGKRRQGLLDDLHRALHEDLDGRILDFDETAGRHAAAISARLRAIGRPIDIRDAMISGIVGSRKGTLATRNIKHFAETGIRVVNPWQT